MFMAASGTVQDVVAVHIEIDPEHHVLIASVTKEFLWLRLRRPVRHLGLLTGGPALGAANLPLIGT